MDYNDDDEDDDDRHVCENVYAYTGLFMYLTFFNDTSI